MLDTKIEVYADGASVTGMLEALEKWGVSGFTTNPSLMKKAGVTDYMAFAKEALATVKALPISFEVFADDFKTMALEAEALAQLGENVFVKIPITNSKGESSVPLIKRLSQKGIQLNVTAILTIEQVTAVAKAFQPGTHNIVSVFAGRVADTGVNPLPLMQQAIAILKDYPQARLLWASCREVLNIFQAQELGVDIITVTNPVLKKLSMVGKDPKQLSLETVQGFQRDVKALGFAII